MPYVEVGGPPPEGVREGHALSRYGEKGERLLAGCAVYLVVCRVLSVLCCRTSILTKPSVAERRSAAQLGNCRSVMPYSFEDILG